MDASLASVLIRLGELGVTLRAKEGQRLSATPAGLLTEEDLEAMRPWADTLRMLSRRPLTPWRSLALGKALEGADPELEAKLARVVETFSVVGVSDARDPRLFPTGRWRALYGD
ncbi:protein of unknown function DUF111 (plasmid) [Oceanithermus profundus DSM 14977]|uniref:TubC N-terminal docking domain-containing protein n=1 Tax=Oceanithermus profundus (strain DSM 14977 / NBRC 100410 / VKM B-2274 / 506) TaxID=670487 RepID=E4UAQ1_OCEP5|nr:hypothetical protein [Oceanithermus profundus]ADR37830.1 protein of unknown function DUF111 [Oceanithermus profundus DSM 14977]